MSKKFLKDQAEELLGSELKQIKGGIKVIVDNCTTCLAGCLSGCSKKSNPQ